MELLIIFVSSAFVVVSGTEVVNYIGQDEHQVDIIAVIQDGLKFCTGSMISDLTILTLTACIYEAGAEIEKTTIHFPNNTKPYKIKSADTDGDIVILLLNEEEEPPKCRSKFQLQKSDISEGKGEMRFFNIDEKDDKIMKKPVWISDTKECSEKWKVNLKYRMCVDSAHDVQNELGNFVRGSPCVIDGLLTGIYHRDIGKDKPMIFMKLFKHLPFLENYVKTSAESEEIEGEEDDEDEDEYGGEGDSEI